MVKVLVNCNLTSIVGTGYLIHQKEKKAYWCQLNLLELLLIKMLNTLTDTTVDSKCAFHCPFFQLPEDLIACVLSELLIIDELAALDIAVCHSIIRPKFLSIFHSSRIKSFISHRAKSTGLTILLNFQYLVDHCQSVYYLEIIDRYSKMYSDGT